MAETGRALRAGRWWVMTGTLLVLAVALAAAERPRHRFSAVYPAATRSPVALADPIPRAAPVALRIPAIGVAVALSQLGLNADGTVQVPSDYAQAGWYRLGPSPGEVGSAVILGHVDSHRGPAVFFRLRLLRVGDRIQVGLVDGVEAQFMVTKVAMYPKEQFPASLVYGSHGSSALQLVTCGGAFDTRTRSYRSNVVVFSSLVAIRRTASRPG